MNIDKKDENIDLDAYFNSEEHKKFLKGQKEANEKDKLLQEKQNQRIANLDKARNMMEFLDIPLIPQDWGSWDEIYAIDLYDIFMDKEKLEALICKLRNKAFW